MIVLRSLWLSGIVRLLTSCSPVRYQHWKPVASPPIRSISLGCLGPGEIPIVAQRLAQSGQYAAIITLGAVIRGETTHDEHINRGVSLALIEIALSNDLPVLFGVLTCNSMEQAIHRAGGNVGNKGSECAEAALKMVGLLKSLPER